MRNGSVFWLKARVKRVIFHSLMELEQRQLLELEKRPKDLRKINATDRKAEPRWSYWDYPVTTNVTIPFIVSLYSEGQTDFTVGQKWPGSTFPLTVGPRLRTK